MTNKTAMRWIPLPGRSLRSELEERLPRYLCLPTEHLSRRGSSVPAMSRLRSIASAALRRQVEPPDRKGQEQGGLLLATSTPQHPSTHPPLFGCAPPLQVGVGDTHRVPTRRVLPWWW